MADQPRILVIARDPHHNSLARQRLAEGFDVVVARSMPRAIALLREQTFDGVYVDSAQLSTVRWAGVMLQSDEILDSIADGVAVVDPEQVLLWTNPEFRRLTDPAIDPIGLKFDRALGAPEVLGPERCPFLAAASRRAPAETDLRIDANHYVRVTVTPVFDADGGLVHMIVLTRDITSETQQEQKINAIHQAGDELADMTPAELAEMGVEERTDLLKFNITRHMQDLLGLDFIEIRLLERPSLRLVPLLTEGMTPLAANRELYAREEGNGVTGWVAATGMSYLCADTANDPRYLEGAAGARSSLTVPLMYHRTIIGTLNVESATPDAFDERDRQFLEIYARNIASALNMLELLQAEKEGMAMNWAEAITGALALPIDDILNDATTVLDRYAGHDEDIVARLRHLLYRAREIRGLIQKVASTMAPKPKQAAQKLADARLLVVDADEAIRRSAHDLLWSQGATIETARDAHEAIALARQTTYDLAMVDIRLPDLDGYESFRRLREVQPAMPIMLMTGFGYDPTHSIVKARQEGLQTVLYKPFRADRLMEAVEQALRPPHGKPREPGRPAS